jgi:hypothetical protein
MGEGRGGFWNRAGRLSGGNRPRALDIVVPFVCACGNDDPAKMGWFYNPRTRKSWQRCDVCSQPTGRERSHV